MPVNTDAKRIQELLSRGVAEVVVRKDLEAKLAAGKPLRIKHGVDPTTSDLHLGYAVVYRKLKELQEMGHKIVFLIGSFTARFGDPTDKGEQRHMRSADEVKAASAKYIAQLSRLLDVAKIEVVYNGDWYDHMTAEELLHLMSQFTVARMLERDMFRERMREGKHIGLHEPVYPVLQGFDSVMIKSDITVVGSDQLFNELQARPLQESAHQPTQDIIAMQLLVGTDGKHKMSQSLGNDIKFDDAPEDQYGKIMSLPDSALAHYFELVTRIPMTEVKQMLKAIEAGELNPRDAKMQLGREVVTLFYGAKAAQEAEAHFTQVFQRGELPTEMATVVLKETSLTIVDLLIATKLAPSKSQARQLIAQGGIKVDGTVVKDAEQKVTLTTEPKVIQKGKRSFVKVVKK